MKRFLITGASRGIGRAIAQKLASQDTTLLLHGRDEAALHESERLVAAKGAAVTKLFYDLSDPGQISRLLAEIGMEPLDALINNAGIAVVKPLAEISQEEWQRSLAINVTAPFLLTQRLVPQMRAGASIVNILSVAARTGFAGWSAYCMSKFALEGFSQSVREELRPRGIRVINVYPAATNTEIWSGVQGEFPREKMMSANDIAEAVAFAVSRSADTAVENISLSNTAGRL